MPFYPAALPLSRQTLAYTAGVIRRHRKRAGSRWRKLTPGQQALLVLAYLRKGETFAEGTVVRIVPEHSGKGGYLLLRLPQHGRPAMLLAQHISEDLRADLNNGQVEMGEEIYVEVTSVDAARNKVLLRELPDPQGEESMTAAA